MKDVCAKRHSRDGKTGWCLLAAEHDGPCQVVLSEPPPRNEYMPNTAARERREKAKAA
jgi:hypothetical protein